VVFGKGCLLTTEYCTLLSSHDTIVESGGAEDAVIEHEASRIAKKAILALKRSRIQREKYSVETPTWTGKAGTCSASSAGR
jgi:DNA excision repair protein ERCC-6